MMRSLKQTLRNNQLVAFFLLNFLLTWFFFFLPSVLGITDKLIVLLLSAIGGSGPAIAAIMLSALLQPDKTGTRSKTRWLVFSSAAIITILLVVTYLNISITDASVLLLLLIAVNAGIAAYIVSGGFSHTAGIRGLLDKLYQYRVSLAWYGVAFMVPLAIYLCSGLAGAIYAHDSLSLLLPRISLSSLFWLVVSFGYIGLIRGPMREEVGWRGFALPRLQEHFSPLVATLILSVIWTFWHLPLYLNGMYPGGISGILDRCYWNIALTFLFTWIYNHTKGSLLLVTLFHTTINTCGTLIAFPDSISGPFSLAFIILVNTAAIVVIIADRMWIGLAKQAAKAHSR